MTIFAFSAVSMVIFCPGYAALNPLSSNRPKLDSHHVARRCSCAQCNAAYIRKCDKRRQFRECDGCQLKAGFNVRWSSEHSVLLEKVTENQARRGSSKRWSYV
jgi:hypothetical protein